MHEFWKREYFKFEYVKTRVININWVDWKLFIIECITGNPLFTIIYQIVKNIKLLHYGIDSFLMKLIIIIILYLSRIMTSKIVLPKQYYLICINKKILYKDHSDGEIISYMLYNDNDLL